MNKRMKQMMGGAAIGTTLAAIAAIGAGQVASATYPMGTCATTATFTETGTCTVLAGEVINFGLKGGDGGLGGAGGAGGAGGPSIIPFVPGGIGGTGGLGGPQGAGALVVGSYANSTDATVTLFFIIGARGLDGSAGVAGVPGGEGVSGFPGAPGTDGTDGGDGTAGTYSLIQTGDLLLARADGGRGGTGGKGGKGGTGATAETAGTAGAPGENGLRGSNGSYAPSPLPENWMSTDSDLSDPRVDFWGYEEEQLTTTTVPVTTTVPETTTTVPVTTTAPPQLPATGGDAGPTVWVTLLVLASGASLVVVARRRVVS